MQEIMEKESREIGLIPCQRGNGNREASRNGCKSRSLNTRVGAILLAKPQIRDYSFLTQLFKNYQRGERTLIAIICQMAIKSVFANWVKGMEENLEKMIPSYVILSK